MPLDDNQISTGVSEGVRLYGRAERKMVQAQGGARLLLLAVE